MYKLHKSKSNPSKFHVYIPTYNGSKLAPQSSRQFINRSASGFNKFGIRQLPLTPKSRQKNSKQKSKQKMQINNLNFNVLICNKQSPIASPPNNIFSNRSKLNQTISTKVNFFKSNNITKTLNKMNENIQRKKKMQIGAKFDFNPIKVLTKGQYGNLYLAYSKQSNFLAVLKSFHKQKVDIKFMIDQFKIQLYCKHPNILPAYGYFFGKNEAYLIMQSGSHNLYQQIKHNGYLNQKKTATYIHQILKGLAYLHLNGIIHRDIKPQNIIICGNIAKITDFGWSVITNSERKTFCGTMDYVSPQVSQGAFYDNKIDCWSIGVLAYQMMVGFPPYELKSKNHKQRPVLNYKIKPKFPTNMSKLAQQFILSMLQFDPDQRLSSVQALRDPWVLTNSEQFNKKQQFLSQQPS